MSKIEEEGLELRLINEDIGAFSLSSGKLVNSSSSKQPLFQGPACFQGAGYNSSPSCVYTSTCGDRTNLQQQSASSSKGPSCG